MQTQNLHFVVIEDTRNKKGQALYRMPDKNNFKGKSGTTSTQPTCFVKDDSIGIDFEITKLPLVKAIQFEKTYFSWTSATMARVKLLEGTRYILLSNTLKLSFTGYNYVRHYCPLITDETLGLISTALMVQPMTFIIFYFENQPSETLGLKKEIM